MSEFTWKTEMRGLPESARTEEEAAERRAARAADRLYGQAAARRMDDGRWSITTMPDYGTFATVVMVSADDMRALAQAVRDTDHNGAPRTWPRLTEPSEDVTQVRQTGGNRTVWTRMRGGHYWWAPGWEQGVDWAQVLTWGEVEEVRTDG